jgi:hypothetical protein
MKTQRKVVVLSGILATIIFTSCNNGADKNLPQTHLRMLLQNKFLAHQ